MILPLGPGSPLIIIHKGLQIKTFYIGLESTFKIEWQFVPQVVGNPWHQAVEILRQGRKDPEEKSTVSPQSKEFAGPQGERRRLPTAS